MDERKYKILSTMMEEKKFPPHWGRPPQVQNMDLVSLPGGYGQGSSTVGSWIQAKMHEDEMMAELNLVFSDPWFSWWIENIAWLIFVGLTIFLKRRSLQRGGYMYQYDKSCVDKEVYNRRRRLRDTLNDPVLVRHWEKKMEYTLGSVELAKQEIQTWRETVQRWEQGEDDEHKEANFIRRRGKVIVPSLRVIKFLLVAPFFYCSFVFLDRDTIRMYVTFVLAHFVDNWLIERKFRDMRRRSKRSKNVAVVAAIGIPAAEPVSIV